MVLSCMVYTIVYIGPTPHYEPNLEHQPRYFLHSQNRNQFPVQVECFCSSPWEEHQHKVLEEGSTDATEDRNWGSDCSKNEGNVHAHQSKAEIDENLFMFLLAQFPKEPKVHIALPWLKYSLQMTGKFANDFSDYPLCMISKEPKVHIALPWTLKWLVNLQMITIIPIDACTEPESCLL